jgi:hypothetical protein
MISVPALALALAVAGLPYPAPRLLQPTDRTKCDMGTVLSVDGTRSELRVTTPAGVVTYKAGFDVQVFDRDGKPLGPVAKLSAGDKVRVYYVVEDGARAQEVDRE